MEKPKPIKTPWYYLFAGIVVYVILDSLLFKPYLFPLIDRIIFGNSQPQAATKAIVLSGITVAMFYTFAIALPKRIWNGRVNNTGKGTPFISRPNKLIIIALIFILALVGIISLSTHKTDVLLSVERAVYGRQLNINTYELIILEKPNNLHRFIYHDTKHYAYSNSRYKVQLSPKQNFFGLTAKKGIEEYTLRQELRESDSFILKEVVLPTMPLKNKADLAIGPNYIIYDENEYLENYYPTEALEIFDFDSVYFYDKKNNSV